MGTTEIQEYAKSENRIIIDDLEGAPLMFRNMLVVDNMFDDSNGFYDSIIALTDASSETKINAKVQVEPGQVDSVEMNKIFVAFDPAFSHICDELTARVASVYHLFKASQRYPVLNTGLPETMNDCVVEVSTVKMYKAGSIDNIGPHSDTYMRGWENTRTVKVARSTRFMNCIFYLNDVAEGGETEFYFEDCTVVIKPKKGRIAMFPPLWTHIHAGVPTVSHDKYIVNCHLRYAITEEMWDAGYGKQYETSDYEIDGAY